MEGESMTKKAPLTKDGSTNVHHCLFVRGYSVWQSEFNCTMKNVQVWITGTISITYFLTIFGLRYKIEKDSIS